MMKKERYDLAEQNKKKEKRLRRKEQKKKKSKEQRTSDKVTGEPTTSIETAMMVNNREDKLSGTYAEWRDRKKKAESRNFQQ
jgi:hypothetical protein